MTTAKGRIRYFKGLPDGPRREAYRLRLIADGVLRMGHCTLTFMGHSPACDRDGTYCSKDGSHKDPCTPHGGPK